MKYDAVERDLAKYDAAMSEKDRFEMALEQEREWRLKEYLAPLDAGCGEFLLNLLCDSYSNNCPHFRGLLEALGKDDDVTAIKELKAAIKEAAYRIAEEEAREELMSREEERQFSLRYQGE